MTCDACGLFEKFTEEARQVVVRAQEVARSMGHGSIETEHELLALFDTQDVVVDASFAELGITSEQVRAGVWERLGPGSVEAGHGQMPFSPTAKKVLEVALREALSFRQQHIGPEHLLLAIAAVTEGGASQVLTELGADADRVRGVVAGRLAAPAPEASVARIRHARRGQAPSFAFTAVPDAALARALMAAAGIALGEQRTMFDITDVLRASLRDIETVRRIRGLGLDLGPVRERFGEEPPAA